jgi:hypothetical protein
MPRDGAVREIGGQRPAALAKSRATSAPKRGRTVTPEQVAAVPLHIVLLGILQGLKDDQAERKFYQQQRSRADRSVEQFIARSAFSYQAPKVKYHELGEAHAEGAKKQAKATFADASAFREAVEKNAAEFFIHMQTDRVYDIRNILPSVPHDRDRLERCVPIIVTSYHGRVAWDDKLKETETRMERLAKSLPVYPWTKQVLGFGDKGLAIILAETGDLSNYATKEKVWKRLGLAVNDAGRRQGIVGETSSRQERAEKFIKESYNPRRRAEMWTLCDAMMRHQWTGRDAVVREKALDDLGVTLPKALKGDKLVEAAAAAGLKDIPLIGRPAGPYGVVYLKELLKAMQPADPERGRTSAFATAKHRESHARRLAWKALIKDLWREWNRIAREA